MASLTEELIAKELKITAREIAKRSLKAGQKASGKTLRSLEVKSAPDAGQLLGASYFGVLEGGRGPGKVPNGFKNILRKWAAHKGLQFDSSAAFDRWAWFTINKIKKEGTKLYRSGRKLDIFTTPIKELNERLTKQLRGFYSAEVLNEINKF